MRKTINFNVIIFSIIFSASTALMSGFAQAGDSSQKEDVSYYTCGMHPTVKVSPEAYKKGETKCPICSMPLTPVIKKPIQAEGPGGPHVMSRVTVQNSQLQRAGIQTALVAKRHLFKEIRTVGTVAYDPKLAVAQDEYLSAVRTLEKIQDGKVSEITQRAQSLVISAEKKLRLLGLSERQIEELKTEKQVQANLILPDKTAWIYGDMYEYELPWITEGAKVKVTSISLPGKEFYGYIASINPVLDPMTRTLRFRALVDNPELKLKPQMYVNILVSSHYAASGGEHEVLAIPKDALLDTGSRQIVWVEKSPGDFEGRMVEVGPSASVSGEKGQFYPVISGLEEGDSVVTSGNFLIDSQSQITGSAASSFGGSLSPVENSTAAPGARKGSGHAH